MSSRRPPTPFKAVPFEGSSVDPESASMSMRILNSPSYSNGIGQPDTSFIGEVFPDCADQLDSDATDKLNDDEEFDLFLNSAKSVYEFFSTTHYIKEQQRPKNIVATTEVVPGEDEVFYDALSDSVVVKVAAPDNEVRFVSSSYITVPKVGILNGSFGKRAA